MMLSTASLSGTPPPGDRTRLGGGGFWAKEVAAVNRAAHSILIRPLLPFNHFPGNVLTASWSMLDPIRLVRMVNKMVC